MIRLWHTASSTLFASALLVVAAYGQNDPCLDRTVAVNVYTD
jgi:hypothetical protein